VNTASFLCGDVIEQLRTLPDESVQCVVTSPPYFGLRDYGADGQIGLEGSPAEYVAKMVKVFREVRRVLRADGTLWLNLGDSYAADRGGTRMPAQTVAGGVGGKGDVAAHRGMLGGPGDHEVGINKGKQSHRDAPSIGLKHKDLIGIPWRVAFALQADGWYLRQDIVWAKPNPMPESVKDRCTKAHEYIFLLTKSDRYYFDHLAIHEPVTETTKSRKAQDVEGQQGSSRVPGKTNGNMKAVGNGETRNARSVWSITTQPYKKAHFATFPKALPTRCILAGTKAGDVVLDPFGGAGTTALAALGLGRSSIYIDLNPEYRDLAVERLDEGGLLP
jgi:DNA modification methylase